MRELESVLLWSWMECWMLIIVKQPEIRKATRKEEMERNEAIVVHLWNTIVNVMMTEDRGRGPVDVCLGPGVGSSLLREKWC